MFVRSAQSPRWPWRRAFAAAVCLGLAAATPARGDDLDDAQRLFRAGHYAECAERAAREIDRGNYAQSWRVLKIEAELVQGQYAAALASVEEALSIHSGSIRLRLLAHETYLMNGQTARAATELDLVERLALSDPRQYSSREHRTALGRVFLRRGADARQVLEVFYDPILERWPGDVEVRLATAELALAKYDHALAAETLEKAPESARDDPQFHYLRARAYANDDRPAAAAALDAALALNPRHVPSLLMQADWLIDAEQYGAAHQSLDAALEVNPRQPTAWAYRAALAHLAGDESAERAARQTALASWPSNPEVDHTIGRKLSDKYRFAEGAAYQRQSLAAQADYVPARMQLAQDLLRLGDEEEGWSLASDAFDADGYNVVAHNLVTLRDRVRDYRVLAAGNFRVRMEAREAALYGQRALDLLQRAETALTAKYDVAFDRPVAVEIFPRQQDFAVRTFGLPGADGFLGVCFGNVITANSPAALGAVRANWESVLWHELCHAVTLRKSRNKMPRWLSEGISVYEERQADPAWGQSMTPAYRSIILAGKLPPLSQLSGSFLAPESGEALQLAYYQSSLAVEYLIDEFGLDALRAVLDDLGAGVGIDDALARHAAPLNRLDVGFEQFARRRAEEFGPELTWETPDLPPSADAATIGQWLADRPRSFPGLLRLGQALAREENWPELLAVGETLCRLAPDYAGGGNGYQRRAQAHRGLDDAAAEARALAEWAERSSDALDAYLRQAELAEQAEQWDVAAQAARRALAVHPLQAAPHRTLARTAEQLGRGQEAIAAYRALLEFETTDLVDVHYRLARLLRDAGEADAARRATLAALDEAPRFLAAHRLLLELHDDAGNRVDADAAAPPEEQP